MPELTAAAPTSALLTPALASTLSPTLYLALKALHIIAMVAYFAGLFYIFRLFVYHVKYRARAGVPATLAEMEQKLLKIIMLPALITMSVAGAVLLVLQPGWLRMGWLHGKLALYAVLLGYHHLAIRTQKRFALGDYFLSERTCRMLNELPTLVLIGAVVLVVLKPF